MDDLTGIYVLLFMNISTISRALLLLCYLQLVVHEIRRTYAFG